MIGCHLFTAQFWNSDDAAQVSLIMAWAMNTCTWWSILPQIMACCLMAPSHYLNQCYPHPGLQTFQFVILLLDNIGPILADSIKLTSALKVYKLDIELHIFIITHSYLCIVSYGFASQCVSLTVFIPYLAYTFIWMAVAMKLWNSMSKW